MMQQETSPLRAFLILPPESVASHAVECLEAFHAAADAASLLLPAPDTVREMQDVLFALTRRAQELGLAVLVDGGRPDDGRSAMHALGVDGIHLHDGDARHVASLRRELGKEYIIGVCCPTQRHSAMELGEAGADYLGIDQRLEARGENLLAWWAEMFTVPVVAMHVAIPAELPALVRLGADFAVPGPHMWEDPAQAAELAEAWRENLQQGQQGHGVAQKSG